MGHQWDNNRTTMGQQPSVPPRFFPIFSCFSLGFYDAKIAKILGISKFQFAFLCKKPPFPTFSSLLFKNLALFPDFHTIIVNSVL